MVKPGSKIIIKEDYCIGCRLCEVFCITRNSKSGDIIRTYKSKSMRPASGIYFEEKGHKSFAIQCRHCSDAPCIEGCLTGALCRDKKTGTVIYTRDKCVGCWMCLMTCPLGIIKIDLKARQVMSKCDLCIQNAAPVCVENCPNEAIVLLSPGEENTGDS